MTDLNVETRPGTEPALVWGHALLQSIPTGPIDPASLEVENEIVTYDARNHGASPDATASDQLTWKALTRDLFAVADSTGHEHFVAGGVSMGAATALTAATLAPDRILGLVLVIPPSAWGVRWVQRVAYGTFGSLGAAVPVPAVQRASRALRGAARSDLPGMEVLADIDVPTLVFGWHLDPSHPHSTARRIAETIPAAELVTSKRPGDAGGWKERVEEFVRTL
jgi:pimeloyl-ACP methyl ester carboxylesterase